MKLLAKIELLLNKTNNAIEPYLERAVNTAISEYAAHITETLNDLTSAPEAPATLKPAYTPVTVTPTKEKVPMPYINILNYIRKNEGEHLTYGTIASATSLSTTMVKKRLYTLRTKGIVRAEGSTASHRGLRYYITRDRSILSNLA
jgi:hypothetical protein